MLSVITPVLDGFGYVEDCIASVAEMPFEKEHIFVDGGSTDGTLELLRGRNEVRCITQTSQPGMYGAINEGVGVCRGRYLTYLNVDDRATSPGYEALYRAISGQSAPMLAYGNSRYHYLPEDRFEHIPARRWGGYFLKAGLLPFTQPAAMFTRHTYDQLGGFAAHSYRIAGDLEFFRRMAMLPDFSYVRVRLPAADFLKHGNSLGDLHTEQGFAEREQMGVPRSPRLHHRLLFEFAQWV